MLTDRGLTFAGFMDLQERNIFARPMSLTIFPLSIVEQIRLEQPVSTQLIQKQTPAPSPSDLERLIGGVIQVVSVLAEGYVKFVLLPKLNAEVHVELKEAVRKNRLEDVIGLVVVKNILDKLSDN